MKTILSFKNNFEEDLPKAFQSDDVRFPESFVSYFLKNFTKPGYICLDPFAGFGTTLLASEKSDRIPYGVEYDLDRFNYIKSKIQHKSNIIHGDATLIDTFGFPEIDFVFTSPPYMTKDSSSYALSAYTTEGSYKQYLETLGQIFGKIGNFLKKDGYCIIEASNIKTETVTTLAWDIAKEVGQILNFQGEIVIEWEAKKLKNGTHYGGGYDHSYCLIFKK